MPIEELRQCRGRLVADEAEMARVGRLASIWAADRLAKSTVDD
jgi:hypothetical protein